MRTYTLIALIALAAAGAALPLLGEKNSTATQTPQPDQGRIARGKYLVSFGGCADCHTPLKFGPAGPEPDMSRFLSGHPETTKLPPPPKTENSPWFATTAGLTAWSGPWGISYAANLTPDENTGLGIWTEEMFVSAMRTGKHMGSGREILPPMPWRFVGQLHDDDLKAVFAYLRSIPAIKNRVPEPVSQNAKLNYE